MNNATPDFNSQHFEVAGFIREVFGYMERFKGQLFVLKIEDDLMSHPLFPVLMRDIAILHKAGIRIIIVPGTRNSIDAQLKAWELESSFYAPVSLPRCVFFRLSPMPCRSCLSSDNNVSYISPLCS